MPFCYQKHEHDNNKWPYFLRQTTAFHITKGHVLQHKRQGFTDKKGIYLCTKCRETSYQPMIQALTNAHNICHFSSTKYIK